MWNIFDIFSRRVRGVHRIHIIFPTVLDVSVYEFELLLIIWGGAEGSTRYAKRPIIIGTHPDG